MNLWILLNHLNCLSKLMNLEIVFLINVIKNKYYFLFNSFRK